MSYVEPGSTRPSRWATAVPPMISFIVGLALGGYLW